MSTLCVTATHCRPLRISSFRFRTNRINIYSCSCSCPMIYEFHNNVSFFLHHFHQHKSFQWFEEYKIINRLFLAFAHALYLLSASYSPQSFLCSTSGICQDCVGVTVPAVSPCLASLSNSAIIPSNNDCTNLCSGLFLYCWSSCSHSRFNICHAASSSARML